jgi:GR25 family glycosyltransferase involved in LPS biosynthesis
MIFDKILYINLDRRPDRKQNVEAYIKKYNLEEYTKRFPAIDGKKIDFEKIDTKLISQEAIQDAFDNKQLYTTMTIGGIGCALSHYNIYIKIINEKINRCLILEDDIIFADDFSEKCAYLEPHLNTIDYDLFFLGYHDTSIKYSYYYNYRFKQFNRVYGLFGYIVTLEGAKKLMNIFPLKKQIDTEISNYSSHLNILGLPPRDRLIFSDQSSVTTRFGTDIQTYDTTLIKETFIEKYIKVIFCTQLVIIFTLIFIIFRKCKI